MEGSMGSMIGVTKGDTDYSSNCCELAFSMSPMR